MHGELCFVRIYSGRIRPGDSLWNPRVRRFEKVARVMRMHANAGEALAEAGAGDIVALTGCKSSATGDTLCTRDAPIVLERLEFPEPVIALVIEPAQSGDRDKLRAALARLEHEDPTFHVKEDGETGQWIISGMGELHLEVAQHRLQTDFHVQSRVGTPRVAYREAPTQTARGRGEVERTLGGKDIYGCVEIELRPTGESHPAALEWAPGLAIPETFRRAIAETLRLDAQVGPRFGYPLARIALRVVGGTQRSAHGRRDGLHAGRQPGPARGARVLRGAAARAADVLRDPDPGRIRQWDHRGPQRAPREPDRRRLRGRDPHALWNRRALEDVRLLDRRAFALSQGRAGFSMSPAGHREVPEEELAARGLVWT